MINILKKSILKNLIVLIHGPILLLNSNNNNLKFKNLENINTLVNLLGFKLNNKIYSRNQIKNIKKLSYNENVLFFYNFMKTFTKVPYYKLKNQNIHTISK
jgi:hypothetical protein